MSGSITDGKGVEGVHSCHQVTAEARMLLSPVLTGLLHASRVMRYIRERFTFLHTVIVHLEFVSHASIPFSGNVLVTEGL